MGCDRKRDIFRLLKDLATMQALTAVRVIICGEGGGVEGGGVGVVDGGMYNGVVLRAGSSLIKVGDRAPSSCGIACCLETTATLLLTRWLQ
jgi:hypothetical protein